MVSFSNLAIDKSWAFAEKTRKDTAYATHGYHSYPAKFIPQIVSRIAEEYTKKGDTIADPFGGCGTTLVEAKIMGRKSIGVDINPVAVMITKAKTTPIDPDFLTEYFKKFQEKLNKFNDINNHHIPSHERIDYWFKPEQKNKLAILFSAIQEIENLLMRNFFLCAFSNILKKCSIWLQKSNKPTRDFHKIIPDPLKVFERQVKLMMKGNEEFFSLLVKNGTGGMPAEIFCQDARKVPVKEESVSLVVTSPPYVTSYEYADLHQLTALWLEYTSNLNDFRKKFIGTAYVEQQNKDMNSSIAKQTIDSLLSADKRTALEVGKYFSDMNQVFLEMYRYLRKGGLATIVIGNTKLKGVDIFNAEVFYQQLQNIGFKEKTIIKREIPSKNLPSTRDSKTGRFAKISSKNKISAYPTEYILLMEKK